MLCGKLCSPCFTENMQITLGRTKRRATVVQNSIVPQYFSTAAARRLKPSRATAV